MLTEKIQLEADEEVLIQVRKHWFIISIEMLAVVSVGILPIPLYLIVTNLFPVPFDIKAGILMSLYSGWLLCVWMALFSVWTNYYLDVWTITNKRLISVDQQGLFNRTTGSFRLERLQDINITIRGIIATFLDYGDLQAETASNDREFVARNIPHPQELKALILRASDHVTYNADKNMSQGIEV